ncbi:exodeoxyribonuclease V subunit alpha [Nocardioides sp.]|uniref:exodeoxyribonuclease V subunit alpha n=1 Tax=Nocardioides sp. TaxID=35761 RepID=UPI0035295C00
MTELFEPDGRHDRRLARSATGLLAAFNQAGVLEASDLHVATRVGELVDEPDESVRLAVALAVRAVRRGSVALDLVEVADLDPSLPWPEPSGWLAAVAASPLVAASVLHVDDGLVSLDRYWREEGQVADDLVARAARPAPPVDPTLLTAAAGRVFPAGFDEQRAAATAAADRWTTVLTGGPGTGKTTAVAGLLALLAEQEEAAGVRLRVALTAPTGKAAARLQEAVAAATRELPADDRARLDHLPPALTLHRLLGFRPGSHTRFRHDRDNRLPHDVVVVDETSMVSLTMMARLLEAVRPQTRLVLVGDPDQLASVEAGAVLADLVAGLGERDPGSVVALRTSHRFGEQIGALAAAIRDGDADTALALLHEGGDEVELVDPSVVDASAAVREVALAAAREVHAAAEAGDASSALAALDRHRLLCAHREGPFGAGHWNRQVERWLGDELGTPVGGAWGREWYAGRPLLVTANDYGLRLYNGDTGVVVRAGDGLRAVIASAAAPVSLATTRLADVETMHAMTVHKSQGSQAEEVTVLLPDDDSRLLSRELFYTAVTRAQSRVRVVGTEAAVRAAVERRALRASGLRQRLARTPGSETPA